MSQTTDKKKRVHKTGTDTKARPKTSQAGKKPVRASQSSQQSKRKRQNTSTKVAKPESKSAKPATRSELKQATKVKKQEEAKKKNQVKNRERVREGKKQKADPGVERKPSIWEKIAEDKVYYQLLEIGDPIRKIDKFQRKRVLFSLFIVLIGCLAGAFVHVWLYIAGPLFGFMFYKMQAKKVNNFYNVWKFERQLNFSKFTRLVIPYLKASGGNVALYTIFNKILKRTENESDRKSLYQLMGEMGDNPADIQPFIDYAERSSGTDMSHLFMSTIFDFQQSTFDVSVIDELGKMASEDMMSAIDEIVAMKLKRFVMFPTKVVMSSFILVAGLGAGLMVDNFKELDFSGMMNPTQQIQDVNAGESDKSSESEKPGEAAKSEGEIKASSEKTTETTNTKENATNKQEKAEEKPVSEAEKMYNENIYQDVPDTGEKE